MTTWTSIRRRPRRGALSNILAVLSIACLAAAAFAFQQHATMLGIAGLVLCVATITAADAVSARLSPHPDDVEVVDDPDVQVIEGTIPLTGEVLPPAQLVELAPGLYWSSQPIPAQRRPS